MSEHLDRHDASSRGDWWGLAAVGVVAVVLSLIGVGVAARFHPSTNPGALPLDAGDTSTTSTATTTTTAPAGPLTTGQATTTAVPPEPATLTISEETLDFGEDGETIEVQISHAGGGPASWELVSDSPIVSTDPSQGDIEAGESVTATVSLDRSQISEGDFASSLTLSWAGGEVSSDVLAVSDDNPIIHNPQASPGTVQVDAGSQCSPTMTTISARVRDTSEVDQVIARWSPDGSATRETAMSPIGDDIYEGVIGPFTVVRDDSVRVVAFDILGNAGGASVSVAVTACQ